VIGKKLFLFLVLVVSWSGSDLYGDPSFKTMMGERGGLNCRKYSQEQLWHRPDVKNTGKRVEEQYRHALAHLKKEPIYTIPKKVHFIWIGPSSFPAGSVKNLSSWIDRHPSWEFCFWTDDPERELPVPGMRRRLVSEFDFGPLSPLIEELTNWGGKSDLMRYMILYKEGGIYADHDVECVRPFHDLCSHFDFIAGYEPLHYILLAPKDPFIVNNGLIAARPNHPILKKTIDRACERWEEAAKPYTKLWRVVARTFDPFRYSAKSFIEEGPDRNILFPTCYFQAYAGFTDETFSVLKQQGYVYAIHHFEGHWKTPGGCPSRKKDSLRR